MVTCRRGGTRRKFWKEPLKCTKTGASPDRDGVFFGRGLKILKNPKSTAEAPAVDLSRLNKLRYTKTVQLFIP